MSYMPKPLNTKDVALPSDILELSEKLAQNTHEVWAAHRLADGWTYGPVRDDKEKTHPSLVPYEQLSEPEKDYDRNIALEALRFMIAHGYKITSGKK
jgi:hypothetical protein